MRHSTIRPRPGLWLLLAFLFAVVVPLCLEAQAANPSPPTEGEPPTVSAMEAIREGASESSPEDDRALLSADLDALFAFTYSEKAPGAAVIVVRDGETLHEAAYGMADLEQELALETDMVFRIGSVTKQFTAVAILMLVEEGRISLSDPITRFLRDYPTHGEEITLHHLLTHVSGIPSYTAAEDFLEDVEEEFTVAEMIDRFKDKPLEFTPGERYAYNNSAYFLLGAVIEKVSGKSYEEFIQEKIFDPLEMEQSYYGGHAKLIPRRVSGYRGRGDAYQNAPYLSMSQPFSAGALLSTVGDLAKWDAALYTDKLLPKETLAKAWTPATLNDGRSVHYGYGWSINEYAGYQVQRHGGGIPGFVTNVVRVPEAKIFVAVLSNNPGTRPGPSELAVRAAMIALGKPLEERRRVQLDSDLLDQYIGLYEIEEDPENWRQVKREGDRLFTQRRGGRPFPIYAAEKDQFFYIDSPGVLRFLRDDEGRVVGTEWADGGGPSERARKTNRVPPAGPREMELPAAQFEPFVGRYRLPDGTLIAVSSEEGRFYIQAAGQPKLELFAETPERFFLKALPAALEFQRDDSGAVTGLVLQQGPRETRGKRLE